MLDGTSVFQSSDQKRRGEHCGESGKADAKNNIREAPEAPAVFR